MGFIHLSDLAGFVGTGPQSALNPIRVYDGPRVGDEFREWNAMGQVNFVEPPAELDILYSMSGRKGARWRAGQQQAQGPGGAPPPPMEDDEEDAMSDWGDGDASMELSPEAAFGLAQLPAALGVAQRLAGETIQSIELRSQVTPQVIIDKPFAPSGATPPQVQGGNPMSRVFMEKIAKPAAYIKLVGGAVVPVEPYGKPTEDYTGLMLLGTAAVAAVGVFTGVKLGQLLFCPKPAKANPKRKAIK